MAPDLRVVGTLDYSLPVQLTVTRVADGKRVLEAPLGHSYSPTYDLRSARYIFALFGEGCPTRVSLRPADRVSLVVTLRGDDCEMAVRRG